MNLIPWAKAHPFSATCAAVVLAFTVRHLADPTWSVPTPRPAATATPTNPVTLQRAVYQFNQHYPNNTIMLGMKRSTKNADNVTVILDEGEWKSMNHPQRRAWLKQIDTNWVNACSDVKLTHCHDRLTYASTELFD